MPTIVECSCGMVMSVASGGRRTCCIRCGMQLNTRDNTGQRRPAEQPSSSCPPPTNGELLALPVMTPYYVGMPVLQ